MLLFLQVSKNLPDKQKEIEASLKDLALFQQQLNLLSLWASTTKHQLESYKQVPLPDIFDIKVKYFLHGNIGQCFEML